MIPFLETEGAYGAQVSSDHTVQPVQLAFVLEGPNDVAHLKRLSRILSRSDPGVPDLDELARTGTIAFVTTGAASICPIPAALCGVGPPEFHLYDRETSCTTRQRQRLVEAINLRPNCRAFLTRRRALENYLHPDAIEEARGVRVSYGPDDDVAAHVAAAMLELVPHQWQQLSMRTRRRVRCRIKKWLNTIAAERMTRERLQDHGVDEEVLGWFRTVSALLRGAPRASG